MNIRAVNLYRKTLANFTPKLPRSEKDSKDPIRGMYALYDIAEQDKILHVFYYFFFHLEMKDLFNDSKKFPIK